MSERDEELEVLMSILDAQDLNRLSDDEIIIRVEPEVDTPGHGSYAVSLHVSYVPNYPEEAPKLQVKPTEGILNEHDLNGLELSVEQEAESSRGMAMVYTLVMSLRERLTALLEQKAAAKAKDEADTANAAHEAELARTRGTAVTPASFNNWKIRFLEEMKATHQKEEEERIKALPPKEREEARRAANKLTGKQLFERNRNLDSSDATIAGDSIDIAHYERDVESQSDGEATELSLSESD